MSDTLTRPSTPTTRTPSRYGGSLEALSADAFMSLGSMEGMFTGIVEAAPTPTVEARPESLWPGYVAAGIVAAVSYVVHFLPVAPFQVGQGDAMRRPISAAIIAILLGLLARNLLPLPSTLAAGGKRIIKSVIPISIVLIGAGLNLLHLASVGVPALVVIVVCIGVAFASAYYAGRAMGLGSKVSLLIGAGTGICGNSAIVAVAPLIDAEDEDLVLSIGTVNLFGLIAMFACPLFADLLHVGSEAFGIWAGTTIHAVPQVVAAGFTQGPEAGALATLVKLVRVALLAPMLFVMALIYARHHLTPGEGGRRVIVHYARFVPWFVWGFVVMATLGTLGLIPTLNFNPTESLPEVFRIESVSLVALMTNVGEILLTVAMASIGLEVAVRKLAGVSRGAIVTGLVSSVVLAAVSYGLIQLLV